MGNPKSLWSHVTRLSVLKLLANAMEPDIRTCQEAGIPFNRDRHHLYDKDLPRKAQQIVREYASDNSTKDEVKDILVSVEILKSAYTAKAMFLEAGAADRIRDILNGIVFDTHIDVIVGALLRPIGHRQERVEALSPHLEGHLNYIGMSTETRARVRKLLEEI